MIQTKKKNINIHIGNTVRRFREDLRISQAELGFRANLHQNYIGQIERAEKNISLQNLEKIANGLEISIVSLLSSY
jgi:transcriptional regulator with XRE-family HTH domain